MSAQNKALMRRITEEVWNQGLLDIIDEIVAPDYVAHFLPPGAPSGREGFRHFVTTYRAAFPDVQMQIEDQIAEGDRVMTRFTVHGTHRGEWMGIPATGKAVTTTGIVIARFENGQNVEAWVEQDWLGLMQQLGVVPMPE